MTVKNMWMSQKVLRCLMYILILLSVLVILCADVSGDTLSYHVAVLTLNNQLCYCCGAVLLLCAPREEQCAVMRILWSDGVPGGEIHRTISANCIINGVLKWSVYKWVDRFQNGSVSVADAEWQLWWSTSITDEDIAWICSTVMNKRRATIDGSGTSTNKLQPRPWNHPQWTKL
jgi:hypothetical protein